LSVYQRHGGVNGRAMGLWRGVGAAALVLASAALGGCTQRVPAHGPVEAAPEETGNVRVWTDRITLPTHDVRSDPVPRFQATDGRKFYPYPAQYDITAEAQPRTWTVIYLENKYLKVQILPELGGRVFAIYDKLAGQDVVYHQTSIKPAPVGIRGAWVAGGIEFNFPDCHTVSTHDEVHWTTREYPNGSVSVLIGDVERISRMCWTVELCLSPDRACLDDRVYLANRTPIRQRCFYWTNAAVEGTDQVQMILPAPKVVLGTRPGQLDWPLRGSVDYSWLRAYDGGTGIMGVGSDEDFVGAYDHARQVGIAHFADRGALPARKFWTWGIGEWNDYWAKRVSDDNKPYLEMQAGPRVTLSEFAWMQPYEVVQFEETWIPVSRIGPLARANPQAAVRLTADRQKGEVTVGVLTTEWTDGAQVELHGRGRAIWQSRVDLSPEAPLLQKVAVRADDVDALRLIVRDAHGRTIIEHAYGKYAKEVDPPAEVPNLQARRVDASTAEGAAQRFELSWMDCRYVEAVRTIEQALANWPDDATVGFQAGILRLWQGKPGEALKLLGLTCQRSDSVGLQARYYTALASLQTGDLEKASLLLAEMEKLDPKAPDSWVWRRAGHILRAKVLLSGGRFREAFGQLQAVLRVEEDDAYVAALAVYALRREGRTEAALREARRYLLQPDLEPMARLEVQMVTHQPDATLERMLQRDPEVSIELACDYISIADWSMAEAILTGGVGENAKSGMTWLLAGYCAEVMGRMEEAAEYRKRAEAAAVHLVMPSRVEELQAAEHALQIEPRASRAAYYAGLTLMRLMRYDEAIAQWQQAIAIRDDNAVARRCLGLALAKVKQQPEQAVAHLRRAVELARGCSTFYMDLAAAYEDLGRPDEECRTLEEAVRIAGPSDRLVGMQGEAYLAMGQYGRAARTLDDWHFNPAESHYGMMETRAAAWLGTGLQHLLEDDPRAALAALDKALAVPATLPAAPEDAPVTPSMIQFWRAAALKALDRPVEARQALEQAARVEGDSQTMGRSYYSVMNAAHAMLAMKALGQTDPLSGQVSRFAEQPQRRGRRGGGGQSDVFRAYMAFRGAWGQLAKDGGAADVAAFRKVAEDRGVPATWGKLSVMAVEALGKYTENGRVAGTGLPDAGNNNGSTDTAPAEAGTPNAR
jgi:tetratricopeptide (TPR) repeat protein